MPLVRPTSLSASYRLPPGEYSISWKEALPNGRYERWEIMDEGPYKGDLVLIPTEVFMMPVGYRFKRV